MSLWTPTWSIDIDGVEYKNVTLANLTIGSGRTDIYTQAIAGYCNLTLINLDDSNITAGINSAVTIYIDDSNGDPVAIFGGSITDLIVGVQSGGSIGVTQTISIVALGALARLPKVLTEGILAKDLDGVQIEEILSQALFARWNGVPAALTWAGVEPTLTWNQAFNTGLGEIDAGNYELAQRSANTTDIYSLVSALATSGLGYLYENSQGQISYADSTHRTQYLAANGYVNLSANDAFASGLQTAVRAGDVRNYVTVTYKNGAQVTDSDAESIALYGTLAQDIQTTLENGTDATAQAEFYLTLRAFPQANFNQISFPIGSPEIDDSDRDNLLSVFMGMPVNITDLPLNMGSNFQGFVEGWQFQAGINSLTVSLYVTPVAYSLQAFRWNDVPVVETWNTIEPTLEWLNATVVA
jgi:hypothetical protein